MFQKLENQYLRFFLNIAVLLLMLFLIDQVAGNITKRFYFKQISGPNYRATYAIDSTTADILVFGSSRANHHYVPEVFEDSLKMSYYNTGRDGTGLFYHYAIFKTMIKRYKPKVIILDVNPGDIYYSKADYDRLSQLLPYYSEHPEIRQIVDLRSPFEKYKLLSAIYPFNSGLLLIVISNLEYGKTRDADIKGYVPLYDKMKDTVITKITYTGVIDTLKIGAIESMMSACKINNIRLVTSISPLYTTIEHDTTLLIVESLANKYGSEFLNYANDPDILAIPGYFQDHSHLNNRGSVFFSSKVAHKLKEMNYTSINL